MSNGQDADLMNIFWVEVGDYLQTLNSTLLRIEASNVPADAETMREMNRLAHSMKGAARAVGINVIETIAHYMEEIFEAAQNKRMELSPTVCDLLYDGLDLIQNVVNGVENSTDALAMVLARLEQTVASAAPKPSKKTSEHPKKTGEIIKAGPARQTGSSIQIRPPATVKHTTATRTMALPHDALESGTLQLRPVEENVRVPVSRLDRLMGVTSELLVARMHNEQHLVDFQQLQKLNRRWQREWRSVRTAYIRLARFMQNQPEDVSDELLTIFKFLETNQRHLLETSRHLAHLGREMAQYNAQFTLLSEQLQDDVSGMRLVPFETLMAGFQRLVRDLARDTGKEVHLDVNGGTVEMDKAALDALKEPIMHLLRNAVDHGIENPEERIRQGKSATGRVEVSVEQRGKEFLVEISDDGRGLDAFRIGRAAVHASILSSQEVAVLNPDDAYNLIFHPGLSTSEKVTALSGRGMGMDIVRTRVESIRGRVTVQSVPSQGVTFTMRIPVSLTRLSCIMLRAGDQEFAVPSSAVLRMMTLKRDQLFTAEGREMIMLNEQAVPVVPMDAHLGVPAAQTDSEENEVTLLVLVSGERAVAFEVDELSSEQELVLKPLGPEIAGTPYISGAALLGSGDVIIVLDPNDLIRGAIGGQRPRPRALAASALEEIERRLRVLVVDDSITTRTLEKHVLETAGFEVHVAVDGVEAWNRIGEIAFDVVIADVEMPRMTGLELARTIKDNPVTQVIPVILLTSLGKPEQREAGLKAGADAYLVKSKFDQGELLKVIRALV